MKSLNKKIICLSVGIILGFAGVSLQADTATCPTTEQPKNKDQKQDAPAVTPDSSDKTVANDDCNDKEDQSKASK